MVFTFRNLGSAALRYHLFALWFLSLSKSCQPFRWRHKKNCDEKMLVIQSQCMLFVLKNGGCQKLVKRSFYSVGGLVCRAEVPPFCLVVFVVVKKLPTFDEDTKQSVTKKCLSVSAVKIQSQCMLQEKNCRQSATRQTLFVLKNGGCQKLVKRSFYSAGGL